jgi:hypothetical protein
MSAAIKVLRRKRRQQPLSGSVSTILVGVIDNITVGSSTTFDVYLEGSGVSVNLQVVTDEWRVYRTTDGGASYLLEALSGTPGMSLTAQGVRLQCEIASSVSVGLPLGVMIPALNAGVAGLFGQGPNGMTDPGLTGPHIAIMALALP